ncbi:hypothetical protein Leryth_014034 [Lithospermum erythrorhizon]|nr:hypothetical protein Leryth_014034 [Lithospermum erythrorhizon]
MFLLRLISATKSKPTTTNFSHLLTSHFSTSFLITKTPKKFKKKRKKPESHRTKLVQTQPNIIPHFEQILNKDSHFRFLIKTKHFLSKQPHQILPLDDAGKLHQQLGFPRGRKVTKFINNHTLLFESYRHDNDKIWIGFTPLMEKLLEEEKGFYQMEADRVNVVRKLLMMSVNKRVPLSKIYHNRILFGIGEDFRDRIRDYPEYFRVVVEVEDGKRVIELVKWDPLLASAFREEF